MQHTRRTFMTTAGAALATAAATPQAFAQWRPSERYPDPAVEILDPSFAKDRLGLASVERLATGMRWCEGPAWFGAGRYLHPCQNRALVGIYMWPVGDAGGVAGRLDPRDIALDPVHVDDGYGRAIFAGDPGGEGRGHRRRLLLCLLVFASEAKQSSLFLA